MAGRFVNDFKECPFKITVFNSDCQTFSRESLESVLDPAEAKKCMLDIGAYKKTIAEICSREKPPADRITLVVSSKCDDRAVAVLTLKKNRYDPKDIISLPGCKTSNDTLKTTRKDLWELEYLVRRLDFRGKCLGDICIACALELLSPQSTARTCNIWLVVAGSFSNSAAIRLYLSYNFTFAGIYRSALMMALTGLDQSIVTKALLHMQRQLDCCFLLPGLKVEVRQEPVARAETVSREDLLSQSSQERFLQEEDTPSSNAEQLDPEVANSSREPRRKRTRSSPAAPDESNPRLLPKAVSHIVGGRTRAHLQQFICNLEFRPFLENLKLLNSLLVIKHLPDGLVEGLICRAQQMVVHASEGGRSQCFFQNLEIARQLEIISQLQHENILNTARRLTDEGTLMLSYAYLREIISVGWAVYRYPVLKQVKMSWSDACRVIPHIATCFDENVYTNQPLPENVTNAQATIFRTAHLRIEMAFPTTQPGDGDGLPQLDVLNVNGFFLNDQPFNDLTTTSTLWPLYPEEFKSPPTTKKYRSRLLGYDTQESPRPGDRDLPQPFWEEGRQFLEAQLCTLRGEVPLDHAFILGDCYGVDVFGRLLLDIRGVYDRRQRRSSNDTVPTIGQFEIARRALLTGYAFPTNHYFTSQTLWDAFQLALREKRGAFGTSDVIHPSQCRRERYESETRKTRGRRKRSLRR